MNQKLLICFNGKIHAIQGFTATHLKQSLVCNVLPETCFPANSTSNTLLNEMSKLTTW